ncbi:single-stranded DNA-binding protein [Nocardioides abyssi]|uniref:Single-stranded DNA-binding protein n=1 Tax=Nocardioides abyssi TaxID=3058370 RepID=A0ABT8EQL1_9ACTN|nr:single-stranded DNA-binding protein [Nocardioides abyssi]MDN4160438.1 single-stranded DNA-binding protein [Nocardioides abyssi]
MSNETTVTLQGWVGGDVTVRQAGDAQVASFRVGATPRRFSRKAGDWVDGETQWYTVNAWRALGDNVAASVRRGDPVVVHGRLNVSTWISSAGVEVTSFEVEATFVGHDLGRGRSAFTKTPRPVSASAEAHSDAPEGSPVGTSAGEVPAGEAVAATAAA